MLLWHLIQGCFCQVKIGTVCLIELRTICEKGLLLLTITIPEMEVIEFQFYIHFPKVYLHSH